MEEDLSPVSKNASGVGEIQEDSIEEVKKAQEERVSKMEEKLEMDESDGEDRDYTDCTFEGVKYDRDEDDIVYDNGMNEVGVWTGEQIQFSKKGKRQHAHSKEILADVSE